MDPKLLSLTRQQVREALDIPAAHFFVDRDYSAEVLDKMDVGHSWKLDRTIIPLYDDSGEVCIGYANEMGWTSAGFPRRSFLYGYADARRAGSPVVLLVEGCEDVWRSLEGNQPAVGTMGCHLTPPQADKLVALRKDVVRHNSGEANQDGAQRAAEDFKARRPCGTLHLPSRFAASAMPPDDPTTC